MKALSFLAFGCVFLVGCSTTSAVYNYDMEVESRPAASSPIITDSTYSDDIVEITVVPIAKALRYRLTNKTDQSIRILFDDAAFVETLGNTHRVLRGEIRRLHVDREQPDLIVPRGQVVTDMLIPSYLVNDITNPASDGTILPHTPGLVKTGYTSRGETVEEFAQRIKSLEGQRLQLLLPVEHGGMRREYIFIFTVTGTGVDKQPVGTRLQ